MLEFTSNKVILKLSARPTIFYDEATERMYVDDNGTLYMYRDIPLSAWMVIKSGDWDFFDSITAAFPPKIVTKMPSKTKLDSFYPPTPTVVMWKVNSSNMRYVGYDADTRSLYVQFLSSDDVYRYMNVDEEVWEGIKNADSKASYLHWFVKQNYPFEKVGGFLLDWSTNYLVPNSGTPHPSGYLTGF